MKNVSLKERIEQFSRQKTKGKPASGFAHFQRIFKSAKKILEFEGLNYDAKVLHAACYLHDIGEGDRHQEKSANQAAIFLRKIFFPLEKIEKVRHAVLEHIPEGKPKSNDAIALHDADLLDFLGATGVTRLSYATSGWFKKITLRDTLSILKQYRRKAFENLVLDTSKRLAEEKIRFMDLAIETLEKELKMGCFGIS